MKRGISAAAGFVINGGAVIPREATPYWRGRSRYVAQALMALGCPILYTVHGYGVCEIGASVRMTDDFIVLMLSTDCNREGAEQVLPVLERAGYRKVLLASSPGPLYDFHEEVPGYQLLEVPRDEIHFCPTNGITIEPRKVIMNASASKTRKLLEASGVEVMPIPYDEVHKYGGGIRCNTMQLIRDPGPKLFEG